MAELHEMALLYFNDSFHAALGFLLQSSLHMPFIVYNIFAWMDASPFTFHSAFGILINLNFGFICLKFNDIVSKM